MHRRSRNRKIKVNLGEFGEFGESGDSDRALAEFELVLNDF